MLGTRDRLVEGECLAVVGFGLGWLAEFAQCGGEVEQAVGLVTFSFWSRLVEGECLAVEGLGIGWFAHVREGGGEVL